MCLEVKVKQNCFALTSLTSFTVFLNWLFNVTIKLQLLQDTFKLHGIKTSSQISLRHWMVLFF